MEGLALSNKGMRGQKLIREMKLSFAIKLTNGVDSDVREGRQMCVRREQDVGDVSIEEKSGDKGEGL